MPDRERPWTSRWPALLVIASAGLQACAPPLSTGGFDAPDPASQAYAIERAARTDDRTVLPQIVAALESDDPAVRFMAINALEGMTGTTLGYRYYDPPESREAAVERWIQWCRTAGQAGAASSPIEARSSGVGVQEG